MNTPENIIRIIEADQCPLYEKGDHFRMKERALVPPENKPACMVLARNLLNALLPTLSEADTLSDSASFEMTCTGPQTRCSGQIRISAKNALPEKPEEGENRVRIIISVLATFPIFSGLSEARLMEYGGILKFRENRPGEVIIRKGDPGINLYVITSGRVEVLEEGDVHIAYLGKGEVFGEMSLISGEPAGATIRVVSPVRLIYMRGKDFLKTLGRQPTVQMYLTRMLARRLTASNKAVSREFQSGVFGSLSEMPPSEILQTLNANLKTGGVDFLFPDGNGRICFKDGDPVHAVCGDRKGIDAFNAVLGQQEGRFRFTAGLSPEEQESPIMGDFMWLLMEGIRNMDEKAGDTQPSSV